MTDFSVREASPKMEKATFFFSTHLLSFVDFFLIVHSSLELGLVSQATVKLRYSLSLESRTHSYASI